MVVVKDVGSVMVNIIVMAMVFISYICIDIGINIEHMLYIKRTDS